MIAPDTLRAAHIVPALNAMGLYTLAAEELLMGTAAVESAFRRVLQFPQGPGRGYFQMEAATFNDLASRVLAQKANKPWKVAIDSLASRLPINSNDLVTNHTLAAAMAMLKYESVHRSVPVKAADHAEFWWRYYNGRSPRGLKPADYRAAWARLCAPLYPAAA